MTSGVIKESWVERADIEQFRCFPDVYRIENANVDGLRLVRAGAPSSARLIGGSVRYVCTYVG